MYPATCPHIAFMRTEIGKLAVQATCFATPFCVTSCLSVSRFRRRSFDVNKFQLSPEPSGNRNTDGEKKEAARLLEQYVPFLSLSPRPDPRLDSSFCCETFYEKSPDKNGSYRERARKRGRGGNCDFLQGLATRLYRREKSITHPREKISFVHSLRNGEIIASQFFFIFFYLKIHRISMHFSPNKATNLEFKHFDSSVLI